MTKKNKKKKVSDFVLIVAKCIVNFQDFSLLFALQFVLIVAKCIVNLKTSAIVSSIFMY